MIVNIFDATATEAGLERFVVANPKIYRAMFPLCGEFPASEVRARLIEWQKLHRR